MEHAVFFIGREFWTVTGLWRCTDVGTRTICAIKLEGDPIDWIGPPYSVAEHVFDEYERLQAMDDAYWGERAKQALEGGLAGADETMRRLQARIDAPA